MAKVMLVAFTLISFSLPCVLGIMCNVCTPNTITQVLCNQVSQLKEVDCANETKPKGTPTGMEFNACATTKLGANFRGIEFEPFVMSCAVKVNSSDPTKVNCSVTEDYVCGDARSRAANNSEYSVTSCISYCCTTPKCNVKHLVPGTPTTAQTPVGTTVESGVPGHWPQLSFVLIGLATCAYMLK